MVDTYRHPVLTYNCIWCGRLQHTCMSHVWCRGCGASLRLSLESHDRVITRAVERYGHDWLMEYEGTYNALRTLIGM